MVDDLLFMLHQMAAAIHNCSKIFICKIIPVFHDHVITQHPFTAVFPDQGIQLIDRLLLLRLIKQLGLAHNDAARRQKLGEHKVAGGIRHCRIHLCINQRQDRADLAMALYRLPQHYVKKLIHIIDARWFHDHPVDALMGSLNKHLPEGILTGTAHTLTRQTADLAALVL